MGHFPQSSMTHVFGVCLPCQVVKSVTVYVSENEFLETKSQNRTTGTLYLNPFG